MINIAFYHHANHVGNKCLNVKPTPKWKTQVVQWIHEGKIKPDNGDFTHFEIEGKE